jgi:DnaJ-class molecular chaperone
MFPDHYRTLGVQRTATQREIVGAYRKFLRTHHPDMDSAVTDRSELLRIMEAFAVLRNPAKRAAYDRELARHASGAHATKSPPQETPAPARAKPSGQNTAQEVPVRVVHRDTPLFRISPVRWERGPWTGNRR